MGYGTLLQAHRKIHVSLVRFVSMPLLLNAHGCCRLLPDQQYTQLVDDAAAAAAVSRCPAANNAVSAASLAVLIVASVQKTGKRYR